MAPNRRARATRPIIRAALPRTRATPKISCERTGAPTSLRMSAPGTVIAKGGWILRKEAEPDSRWRLFDGLCAFAPCAGSTDVCAGEVVCTGSVGGGTYGGGTGAGAGVGARRRPVVTPNRTQ